MRHRRCIRIVLAVLMSMCFASIAGGAEMYVADPAHTSVAFTVRHLMIYKVRGKFTEFTGTIRYDENDMTRSSLHGTIQVASLDTDDEKRDQDLRGAQFLDVEKFPTITFTSTRVEKKDDGHVLIGDLTIHGVTKEVVMPFAITGRVVHRGNTLLGFEARLQINRQDFGITYDRLMDNGGLVVGNTVDIELFGRAIAKKEN
jgi:polyisoprenoid-binding protein YceI